MQLRSQNERGATLILVLVLGGLVTFLAIGTALQAQRVADSESVQGDGTQLTYRCEAAVEALRLEVVRHYETFAGASGAWLDNLRTDLAGGTATWPSMPPPGSPQVGAATYTSIPGVRAWINSAPAGVSWIEIVAATTEAGTEQVDHRAPVSVRMRINIGENRIFDLAMLTETTNCMFCHFHINGDVGSIGFFRPGWGNENGGGRNSGNGSQITGNVYIGTKEVGGLTGPSDDSDSNWSNNVLEDPTEVNGTDVTGTLYEDYTGPKLPEDTIGDDGVPDFPSFDPDEAKQKALNGQGTIWAGNASNDAGDGSGTWVVPHGSDWSNKVVPTENDFQAGQAYGSVVDGNLVLVGTPANPIKLNGNVYVSGDVMIEGTVEGQGAIYAGRNVYVTGDVHYADAPSAGFPLTNDGDGASAVAESTSELRIAARSNLVIGDWTYRDDGGDIQPVRDRQGQDFMNAQFGLNAVRYYQEGDNAAGKAAVELTRDGSTYYDDLGNVVPANQVVTVSHGAWEGTHQGLRPARYDAVMAPGNVVDDGSGNAQFVPWISQKEYRDDVLGREKYDLIQWRVNAPNAANKERELGSEWVNYPGGLDSKDYVADLKDNSDGSKSGMYMKWGGHTKVAETNVEWATQVQHIDGFLFANKRIGGKSDLGALTINGGLAAREIGVLAPGLRNLAGFNSVNGDSPDQIPSSIWSLLSSHTNKYGERTNKMRLHYDYRLRNGGFGFEFFAKTGDLLLYTRGGEASPPF